MNDTNEEPRTGNLAALVTDLAAAREAVVQAHETLDEAEETVKATPDGQWYFQAQESLNQARKVRDEADGALREQAISLLDGGASPHPALTIKNFDVLDYDQAAAMAEAARRGWLDALKLDRRAFDRHAKAVMDTIDAVEKVLDSYPDDIAQVGKVLRFGCMIYRRVEPRVTVAGDLSEWLSERDAGAVTTEEGVPDDDWEMPF